MVGSPAFGPSRAHAGALPSPILLLLHLLRLLLLLLSPPANDAAAQAARIVRAGPPAPPAAPVASSPAPQAAGAAAPLAAAAPGHGPASLYTLRFVRRPEWLQVRPPPAPAWTWQCPLLGCRRPSRGARLFSRFFFSSSCFPAPPARSFSGGGPLFVPHPFEFSSSRYRRTSNHVSLSCARAFDPFTCRMDQGSSSARGEGGKASLPWQRLPDMYRVQPP